MQIKPLIPNYPIGSDLTILDARYHYGYKDDSGKYHDDTMVIIYKDNTTGEKKSYTIHAPEYTYFKLKGDDPGYHQFFVKEEDVTPITCKYSELEKSIAENTNRIELYRDNIRSGNRKANKELHKDRRIFGSDIAVNNYYRMLFKRCYSNRVVPVSKAFIDIECDTRYCNGDFPEPGEVPINAVSYLDFDTHELLTVLYDDGRNESLKKFVENLNQQQFNDEFHELLNYTMQGIDNVREFKLENLTTKVIMYTDEVAMLVDLFNYINIKRPDFILAWNMAFDVPYIIARLRVLGIDPALVICDKSFTGRKYCEYIEDEQHKSEFSNRGDYADISAYPIYLDQMIQFASRRRGQSQFQSMKLDYIGKEIVGVIQKLDYSNITNSIADLPYLDYETFVKYNMMDVVVQYCIEYKTNDVGYVFNKALQNSTEYRKVHRQTVYLANRAITSFYDYSKYIMGNNVNKFKDKPTDKYEGAFVSDPRLVSDSIKDHINGHPINRVGNAVDFDFTRLYPSIAQEFNLAPNTQIGKIEIPEKVYDNENLLRNPKFMRGGAFMEDLTSDNFIEFAHRWFYLADFKELYKDIVKYFNTIEPPINPVWYNIAERKIIPVAVFKKNANNIHSDVIDTEPKSEFKINNLPGEQIKMLKDIFTGTDGGIKNDQKFSTNQ